MKGQLVGLQVSGSGRPGCTALPQKAPGVLCPSQPGSNLNQPLCLLGPGIVTLLYRWKN